MLGTHWGKSPRTAVLSVAATLALTVAAGVVTAAPASAAVTNCGPTFSGGDGSSASPYLISTGADLTALVGDSDCWASAANFLQTTDITLAATWTTTIGTDATHFNGTYDGGGHEISGLTITLSGNYAGLFGRVGASGQISNLGFTGNVTGVSYVGGLIGYNYGGAVTNSYATGDATGTNSSVGGLIGYSTGDVSGSYATGNATGTDFVAGLIGYSTGDVSGSYATGNATAANNFVAGLIGYNSGGAVTNSHATGDAAGSDDVGGLIAYNNGGAVTNSHATGDAAGSGDFAGGLIGYNSGGAVTNSHATGDAAGSDDVGGLIGYNSGGAVTNSYATGNVTGTDVYANAGGLIGYNSSSSDVSNSYATGNVTTTATWGSFTGGLIGYNSSSSDVSNSYATGNVTTTASTTYAGGLIGYNGSSTVSNSYATGNVTTTASTTYAGGLIGGNYGTWSDSFFLDSTSDNGEGTQVSSTQLRDIATFITAGWSIAAGWSSSGSPVWGICGPANNGYPFLNPTVTTNPCAGTAARVEFTYYLPDGRECTNISPSYVILHAQIALPDADADCRTTAGSSIIGWTIPTPRTFTGIGSPQMPFEPGALVNVIDSQQFTAVLREPIQQYDYDSNLDTTTSCTQTLTSHVTQDGRVHHIWVPRADIRFARFPLTAACTPQGHRLIAWNTNGDGTGTTYTRGDPLPTDWATANFNTRTLYAIWGVG